MHCLNIYLPHPSTCVHLLPFKLEGSLWGLESNDCNSEPVKHWYEKAILRFLLHGLNMRCFGFICVQVTSHFCCLSHKQEMGPIEDLNYWLVSICVGRLGRDNDKERHLRSGKTRWRATGFSYHTKLKHWL